jgi:membrane protease YdiL (CAAX protease family)
MTEPIKKGRAVETCLVIATGMLVIYLLHPAKALIYAAIALGVVGAFLPSIAKWVDWAWYKLAEGMGWVMSKVMLSVVFFVILFPIALLSRFFGKKDSLQLKKKSGSYWTERNHSYEAKDLENVW